MGWTKWTILATQDEWFDEYLDWVGPACYELSMAGPQGGNRRIVYVGETANEADRLATYGGNGSHLSEIINWHLREGWTLWVRSRALISKSAAKDMQDNLLARFEYDWNIQLNGIDDVD